MLSQYAGHKSQSACMARQRQYALVFTMNTAEAKPALPWVDITQKKSYKRMQLLTRAAKFKSNQNDLRSIYLTYVRSILEQSVVLWQKISRKSAKVCSKSNTWK